MRERRQWYPKPVTEMVMIGSAKGFIIQTFGFEERFIDEWLRDVGGCGVTGIDSPNKIQVVVVVIPVWFVVIRWL